MLSAAFFALGFLLRGAIPQPKRQCPFLNGPSYEEPCLMDLSTGRVVEMRIGGSELHISPDGLFVSSAADRATAYVPSAAYSLVELDPDHPGGLIVNIF